MPTFTHRSCYVNFAEHLLNRWNVNVLYPDAPYQWSLEEWERFLRMIAAFGFTCFEYWLVPTLFDTAALEGGAVPTAFAARMREVNDLAHGLGLQTKVLCPPNTIGPAWYSACPNLPEDRALIHRLWRHWMRALAGTDIVGIFPGDPGGCNRHGCTHETYIELALELCEITLQENPGARLELGTWGTPFSGWGGDARTVPGWDGSFAMLADPTYATPETPMHIWNGDPARAEAAMGYLLRRLPEFPTDMAVAINLGFSPDGDATLGGDARAYARAIAAVRPITTWDYSLGEGELICYPHWRLPRLAARRREERSAAPYSGGMSYTMSPRLNLLTLYAAGALFQDADADPDALSRTFCIAVFGDPALGELFEAFEIVPGWGHYPRRRWAKTELRRVYTEMVDRLEAADPAACTLPLCVDPEAYRQDLLWFARQFHALAAPAPDRQTIRAAYRARALSIYDVVPPSVDERTRAAADGFAGLLGDEIV